MLAALNVLMHLLITVVFPVLVLQKDLFGTGYSFSLWLGPTGAFMLSALVPAGYVLGMQFKNRKVSPVWLLFTLSALINGLSSFWWTDGLTFALKDSSGSLFLATSTAVSLLIKKPLFGFVIREYLSVTGPLDPRVEHFLQNRGHRLIVLSTVILMLKGLTVATLNTLVKFHLVTGPFGTPEFNQGLSLALAFMVPVAYLSTALAYTGIFVLWQWGLRGKLRFPFAPSEWSKAMVQV